MALHRLSLVVALLLSGCPATTRNDPTPVASSPAAPAQATSSVASIPAAADPVSTVFQTEPAKDERLEIRLTIEPGVETDRVPMHVAELHFRNVSDEQVRIYLPVPEAFRFGLSSIVFRPEGQPPLAVPEPRPHGYVVTDKDFHLLEPGQSKAFEQRFTIDPMARGTRATKRRPGFELGAGVPVRWVYENKIRSWVGGKRSVDGPTRTLFDGGVIPGIWKGRLAVSGTWTVPR
jgi:hypothetical protein